MKIIVLLFIALSLVSALRVTDAQEELSDELLNFVAGLNPKRMAEQAGRLSSDERLQRIVEIKAQAQRNPAGHLSYTRALGFLGDEEALQSLVAEFLNHDGMAPGFLGEIPNPRVIELVAPAFSGEETWNNSGSDVFYIPRSYRAAELAVEILANSPAFSAEVNGWASGLRGLTTPELRTLIRTWWTDNQRHFAEKNYKAVQPGPERPRNPFPGPPPRIVPLAESAVAGSATTPLPPVATPPPATPDAQASRRGWRWIGPVAGSAFVACLFWWWRRLIRGKR